MRKLITSNLVSLDGYLAGPGGDFTWPVLNDEFFGYAEAMLNAADLLIFGRITYELMVAHWPTDHAKTTDPIIAGKMNGLPKIVFSNTLKSADWENTTLLNGDIEKNIAAAKAQPGKDIVILGSGTIVSQLTRAGLIDEHRFIINPVILGGGTPQFTGISDPEKLELTGMTKFKTGVVMLNYQPRK
jgi:dihydrofolate reductase